MEKTGEKEKGRTLGPRQRTLSQGYWRIVRNKLAIFNTNGGKATLYAAEQGKT
jgi:hypothetical protein